MHSILEIIDESTDSAGPDLISLDDLKLALGIEGTDRRCSTAGDDHAAITHHCRVLRPAFRTGRGA